MLHDKIPDTVPYFEEKNWQYFVESVASIGLMEPKRIREIEETAAGVKGCKTKDVLHLRREIVNGDAKTNTKSN